MSGSLVAALTLSAFLCAEPPKRPARKPVISEATVDWLRVYPLAPYREFWTVEVDVKDMKRDLPRVMQAIEKNGGQLIVPLQNAAGSAVSATQQLSYRLTRRQGTAALKALGKVGSFPPPLVRPAGELLPVAEIERKIAALSREKESHAQQLSSMPSVSALVDAVLGHLVMAKAVAEKADAEVILNLTLQSPARP
jgi:hypothetical protein